MRQETKTWCKKEEKKKKTEILSIKKRRRGKDRQKTTANTDTSTLSIGKKNQESMTRYSK